MCLKVKEMGDDGNCMFRAIADQLEGDEAKHESYRRECVGYMRDNRDKFVPFIEDDETIEQYCDTMEKDGIWGGQVEMNALANALKFNVVVH